MFYFISKSFFCKPIVSHLNIHIPLTTFGKNCSFIFYTLSVLVYSLTYHIFSWGGKKSENLFFHFLYLITYPILYKFPGKHLFIFYAISVQIYSLTYYIYSWEKNCLKHILSFSIPYYILYLSYAYFLKNIIITNVYVNIFVTYLM